MKCCFKLETIVFVSFERLDHKVKKNGTETKLPDEISSINPLGLYLDSLEEELINEQVKNNNEINQNLSSPVVDENDPILNYFNQNENNLKIEIKNKKEENFSEIVHEKKEDVQNIKKKEKSCFFKLFSKLSCMNPKIEEKIKF